MWVVGRILLAILLLLGAILLVAGIACLVAADSITDELNEEYDEDVGSGVIRGAGAGATALGLIMVIVSSLFLFRRHRPGGDILG